MIIYLDNKSYEYELKTIVQSSYYKGEISFDNIENFDLENQKDVFLYLEDDGNDGVSVFSNYNDEINSFSIKKHLYEKNIKNCYKRALYKVLYDNVDDKLLWGILTGIRPTKLYTELANKTDDVNKYFKDTYFVDDKKIRILEKVYYSQKKILDKINANDYSIYIHIPFCPSRCSYCTFYSNDINKKSNLVKDFLNALDMELELTLKEKWAKERKHFALYIGGGTPSSLSYEDLEILFFIVNKHIDIKNLSEFTFEAGRVDTLNKEKLVLLEQNGVTRISINPQTMNNETLNKIGRNHSAEDIVDVYNLAKIIGNYSINMDIILGLEEETEDDMLRTFEKVAKLNPDSITVHTLSIKKASDLSKKLDFENEKIKFNKNISNVLEFIYENSISYNPYYLYRQKNIMGGHENIGMAKENNECLYNIVIMEEIQNILAFGPGSVSRFVYPKENRIERVSNTKNLESYIQNIAESVDKKRKEM